MTSTPINKLSRGLLFAALLASLSACTSLRDSDLELEGGDTFESWSDDEILHAFIISNEGEVMTSQPVANAADISAAMQSTPPVDDGSGQAMDPSAPVLSAARVGGTALGDVQEFAKRMIEHHTQVRQRAQDMAANTELDAEPNLVSTTLRNMAEGVTSRLRPLSGMELGQQYIQNQIVLHQNTLNMLDHSLIPSADDPNLRQMLQEARQSVASHLAWAMQIHGSLQSDMSGLMGTQSGSQARQTNQAMAPECTAGDCLHHDSMHGAGTRQTSGATASPK